MMEDRPRFRSECCWTALAGLLTMVLGGVIILMTPGEFWRDDSQSQMMPVFVEAHREAARKGASPLSAPVPGLPDDSAVSASVSSLCFTWASSLSYSGWGCRWCRRPTRSS